MLFQQFTRSLRPIVDLFLESRCPLCGRSTAKALCLDCQRQSNRCRLERPAETWRGDLPLFAWGAYRGKLKQAIAALKYENHPQIAQLLGYWLGEAWLTHFPCRNSPVLSKCAPRSLWIAPIPLHSSKQRQRGYNQAALLAESFCDVTGFPLARNGLVRVRRTAAQFSLSAAERQRNLKVAFEVGQEFRRRHPTGGVLILDDIYTTGATARSAAATLRRQGISVAGIAALARAMAADHSIRDGA